MLHGDIAFVACHSMTSSFAFQGSALPCLVNKSDINLGESFVKNVFKKFTHVRWRK